MSGFAAKLNKETPQSLWKEQEELGGRMMLTIPFGSSYEDMEGFVSVLGESGEEDAPYPVITLCVAKPTGGSIASTIVFAGAQQYTEFVERLYVDCHSKFSTLEIEDFSY
jgi:hypothetical protein